MITGLPRRGWVGPPLMLLRSSMDASGFRRSRRGCSAIHCDHLRSTWSRAACTSRRRVHRTLGAGRRFVPDSGGDQALSGCAVLGSSGAVAALGRWGSDIHSSPDQRSPRSSITTRCNRRLLIRVACRGRLPRPPRVRNSGFFGNDRHRDGRRGCHEPDVGHQSAIILLSLSGLVTLTENGAVAVHVDVQAPAWLMGVAVEEQLPRRSRAQSWPGPGFEASIHEENKRVRPYTAVYRLGNYCLPESGGRRTS